MSNERTEILEECITRIIADFSKGDYIGALGIYPEEMIPKLEEDDSWKEGWDLADLQVSMREAYENEDWETMISLTNEISDIMDTR